MAQNRFIEYFPFSTEIENIYLFRQTLVASKFKQLNNVIII